MQRGDAPAPWWSAALVVAAWCWCGQLLAGTLLDWGAGAAAGRAAGWVGLAMGGWMLGRAARAWAHPFRDMLLAAVLCWLPLPLIGVTDRLAAARIAGVAARLPDFLSQWLVELAGPTLALTVVSVAVRWLALRVTSEAPRSPT